MDDQRARYARVTRVVPFITAISSLMVACGGGGGFNDTTPPLPSVDVVEAFPALSFEEPLAFATAPEEDGVAYVATRGGQIFRFENHASVSNAEIFWEAPDVDASAPEKGLLGFAFHPDYAENGEVYVNYTPKTRPRFNPNPYTQIAYFDRDEPGITRGVLSFEQPFANHNGGWLGFGPDGMLYVASGDGGGSGDPQNNAQRLDTLLGKILRLPRGVAPDDNPFVDEPGARREIWAYGLRNPFRASFDRVTGELWVADVGQSEREEINIVERGGNYGWRKFEGTQVFNASDQDPGNAILPLYEYDHSSNRCSVTGGYVYRGSAIPALAGRYVFADFCSREIWALRRDGAGVDVDALGSVPGNPSSFGEDGAGELYITAFDGKIYKIVPRD